MELNEYPRPANDTGIGMHWVVGYATGIGLSRIREFWIPELKSMGVKWIKIFNHDGALDFCELLLSEGIMPVVRIYRPSPNPGRLGVKELVLIDALIRSGVRYFEFNNEPDVDAEWKGGRVPVNGIDLTVESTIANVEIVLERGGMPAIPALANGSRWDLVGRIVAAGRRDLLDGPVWQAVHNFSRNRPLDYPYDIGNQEGAAYTDRFYRVLGGESWGEDAWRGRSLAEVNRLRYDRRSPGASVMDDHACFLAYEYYDALNRKHLGRSIPILSTECGYLVGEDTDPRYPATTPDLHMAQTLEACRVMMGTSHRFKPAPDYYFCTAFWLLANQQLGSTSTWWESNAWYSERWPNGMLPVVRALQAEPKVARVAQQPPAPTVTLRGVIANAPAGAVLQLELERDGRLSARTQLDSSGLFALPELQAGGYVLRVEGTPLAQRIELPPDQGEVVINLDAAPSAEVVSRSVIAGRVKGGAGAVVMLLRQSDGEEWVTMAHDDGAYRFVDLPPGRYKALVYPGGSSVEGIVLDGRNEEQVNLSVGGWGYTIGVASDMQKVGAIVVSIPGHKGLRVQAQGADWSSPIALTGEATDYGPFAALITPLEADYYFVTVDGAQDENGRPTQLEARVQVDKRYIPLVEFVFLPPALQPPAGDQLAAQVSAAQSSAAQSSAALLSAAQSSAAQSSAAQSSAGDQPAGDQPAGDQPAGDQPAAQSSAAQLSAPPPATLDQPTSGQPTSGQPRSDQLGSDQPVAQTSPSQSSVPDQPSSDGREGSSAGMQSAGEYESQRGSAAQQLDDDTYVSASAAAATAAATGATATGATATGATATGATATGATAAGTTAAGTTAAGTTAGGATAAGITAAGVAAAETWGPWETPEPPAAGGPSRLSGIVPQAGSRNVHAIDAVGNEHWTATTEEGRFVFEALPPSTYSVYLDGGYQHSPVTLDGAADVEIAFAPVIAIWETTVTNAGSMPGFSSVRVEVEGMANLPVRIWTGEEEGLMARTGSSSHPQAQGGANVVEFRSLQPGRYMIEPQDLGVWAEVEISGLEAFWVSFRRKTEPVGANEVRRMPIARGREAHLAAAGAAAAAAEGSEGAASLYVYVEGLPPGPAEQAALLRFVASKQPAVGADLEEAARAGLVLLLGDEAQASGVEQRLLMRNVSVLRPGGDWAEFFNRLGG